MNPCSLTVFGVQPLAFGNVERDLSLSQMVSLDAAQSPDDVPTWVSELEGLYPNRHFTYQRIHDGTRIECDGTEFRLSAWLCSNNVLNQHLVLLELRTDAIDPAAIDVGRLRSLLVLPAGEDARPPAVRSALQDACEKIAQMAGCRREDIGVLRDSCNVTLILTPKTGPLAESDTRAFAHDDAERLTVKRTLIEVSDATRVWFGGRAHVVVSSARGDVAVIKQIMFMLQVMWFYVPLYLRHAAKLHGETLAAQSRHSLGALEDAAGRLVHVYQTVRLQNESAKISYEALASLVYEPAQALWAVEKSVDQLQRYAEFFQSFIQDIREVQSRRADVVLNYVLAALGLFGFVGLWANVLAAEASVRDIATFGNLLRIATSTALGFTTVVFIAISTAVAVWLVVYGIRARYGRKWRRHGVRGGQR